MSETEILEDWVGERIRMDHAHRASSHTDGVLLAVGERGIMVQGGSLVRFFPWTSVASLQKIYEEEGGEW